MLTPHPNSACLLCWLGRHRLRRAPSLLFVFYQVELQASCCVVSQQRTRIRTAEPGIHLLLLPKGS